MITRIPFEKLGFRFLEIETNDSDTEENKTSELFSSLPENGLAIVGTRFPQRKSFDLLEKTMEELKGSGLVIVSGFARGIDSRAHELAIEYGLKTIAILGCGLNIDYPRENHILRKKILAHGGLIISPFETGLPPIPRNFLSRNQLIAYFSKAVWVVEAAANMAISRAKAQKPGHDNLTWGSFMKNSVKNASLLDLAVASNKAILV